MKEWKGLERERDREEVKGGQVKGEVERSKSNKKRSAIERNLSEIDVSKRELLSTLNKDSIVLLLARRLWQVD